MFGMLAVVLFLLVLQGFRRVTVAKLAEGHRFPVEWRRFTGLLLAQDATAALLIASVLAVSTHATGLAGVAVVAALVTLMAADTVLFAACGLRLEPGLLAQRHDLNLITTHARRDYWILAAAGLAGAAAAWPLMVGASAVSWAAAGLLALAGGLVFVPTVYLSRTMPHAMAHAWSPVLFLVQRPGRGVTPRAAVWPLGEHEEYRALDPAYPLLRVTTRFKGERVVDAQVAPASQPHVIFLIMESFRAVDVGVLGGRHATTPCFDALSRESALWSRFYTHGSSSSRALLASLYGVLPGDEIFPTRRGSARAPLVGLPHILAAQGYVSHYFTNGPADFEDNGEYLLKNGFCRVHGDGDIRRAYPEAQGSEWGPFDEHLFNYHLDWLTQQHEDGLPTFSTLFTMTNHDPYTAPDDAPWPDSPVGLPWRGPYRRFLRTMHYADACMGNYVAALRQRGLDQHVVLFVLGDTGQMLDRNFGHLRLGGYLRDEAFHIPLLMWAPSVLRRPVRCEQLGGQIDLLPTVLDLLQLGHPHHSMGASLLRSGPERPVHLNHPYLPPYDGLRAGTWRFNRTRHNGATKLFNIADDAVECLDVSVRSPRRAREFDALVQEVQGATRALHRNGGFVSQAFVDALPRVHLHRRIPRSLDEAQRQLAALQTQPDAALEKILRAYLGTPLDADERLEYLQLRLYRHYAAQLGKPTAAELQRMAQLEEQADARMLQQAQHIVSST